MSDMSGEFEVGYGKPPKENRFKKGVSGNPKGRPKRAANKRKIDTSFGCSAAEEFLKLEAYRPVAIREGDRVIELPAIQAVFRAMGVSAMKGNRFAQRTLAELVGNMEASHHRLKMEYFGTAIDYKKHWEEEIERCRQLGLNAPQPLEHASRATVIVDAEDYFRAARDAMMNARRQILLVGWDFDARIRFKDDDCTDDGPEQVGAFVSWLTKRTPGLQVYILRWDTGAIKTLFHGRTLLRIAKWMRSDQVHLRFDAHHPVGASHHQKIVVIDDDLAFCGGIDMTVDRWD